jgi:pimeloyl-ACP methyl ester carboxylesterase
MGLAISDRGEGKPLVLIHGIATDRTIWDRALPLLTEGRRVIAIDVPGFGASAPIGEGFELEPVAEAILEGLLEAGVEEPFDVLGQSLGGALALTLGAHQAGSVDRVVLGAPAGFGAWPQPLADLIALGTTAFVAGRRMVGDQLADSSAGSSAGRALMFMGAIGDPTTFSPERVRAMIRASARATRIREAMETIVAADLRPELRALRAPLGLVWGDKDLTVPMSLADEIVEIRPGTTLEVIPGVGHIPQMERPEAYSYAIDRLLAQLPEGVVN